MTQDGSDNVTHDGEGDKDLVSRPTHDLVHNAASFVRGRDVEKDEFVGPSGIVEAGLLHRVSRIDQIDKVDSLDDPALVHVEAGYDAFGYRHG